MDDNATLEERAEELSSIAAIFPELEIDSKDSFRACLEIAVELASPLRVCFPATSDGSPPAVLPTPPTSENESQNGLDTNGRPQKELEIHELSYLPSLQLEIALPSSYPENEPPEFTLGAAVPWVPQKTLHMLQEEGKTLWEEYGRSQVVYGYIDFLQQGAERAFDVAANNDLAMKLPASMKLTLLDYDKRIKRKKFEQGTYDCGVCLDPKRGSACHKMERCGHVFCISCLQDFYTSCISEGDVANVKCMDPTCGKEPKGATAPKRRKLRTLTPSELLNIPLQHGLVKRYVDLKRKKKIEADQSTIYCPRKWCQGPARSPKYPKITPSFDNYIDSDSEPEDLAPSTTPAPPQDPSKIDRLAVCEDCLFAFCRVCLASWHGDYVRCWPRTAAELSEDEQASYNYIRKNTSPCPTCNSPVQKTHGCNHMTCFQCRSHFCYLCSSWLDGQNPYQHFNKKGTGCFQRLWELEEGDNGQGAHFEGPRAMEQEAWDALQEDLQAEAEAVALREELAAAAIGGAENPGRARQEAEAFAAPLNVQQGHLNVEPRREWGQGQQPEIPHHPPALPDPDINHDRRRAGLQRFIEMAINDEEDGWDSDELQESDDEDDEFANLR